LHHILWLLAYTQVSLSVKDDILGLFVAIEKLITTTFLIRSLIASFCSKVPNCRFKQHLWKAEHLTFLLPAYNGVTDGSKGANHPRPPGKLIVKTEHLIFRHLAFF